VKLTDREQRHVRTALRYMRSRVGGWAPLAAALHMQDESLSKVVSGRRGVTAKLAFAVARLIEGSIDDLLAGRLLPKACRHCGRNPEEDFADEETVFEDRPREAVLQIVK
jgi:hypothetical protein